MNVLSGINLNVGHCHSNGYVQTFLSNSFILYCLVGLVVKVSASRAGNPEFNSCMCHGNFSGSSHTSDLKIGTPVATLTGAWCYRVSTGAGWPSFSIL